MSNWIIYFLVFFFTVGGIFGLIVSLGGKHPILRFLISAISISLLFSLLIVIETEIDSKKWNNGYCVCGEIWEFNNAVKTKSGDTIYYWYCPNCQRIIELHSEKVLTK